MKKLLSILKTVFTLFIALLVISACSASTGSRYDKNEKVNSEKSTIEKNEINMICQHNYISTELHNR